MKTCIVKDEPDQGFSEWCINSVACPSFHVLYHSDPCIIGIKNSHHASARCDSKSRHTQAVYKTLYERLYTFTFIHLAGAFIQSKLQMRITEAVKLIIGQELQV